LIVSFSIAVTEHEVSSTWLSQTQPGSRPVVPPLNLKPIEEKRGIRTIDPNAFYRSIKKYGKLRNLGTYSHSFFGLFLLFAHSHSLEEY
jgi:hypothetical protein